MTQGNTPKYRTWINSGTYWNPQWILIDMWTSGGTA